MNPQTHAVMTNGTIAVWCFTPGEETLMMATEETGSRYPYLISVRGGRPVPAYRDGPSYVCAYQTSLGLWWRPAEVTVLQHDPHRDFYQEHRQARDSHAADGSIVELTPVTDVELSGPASASESSAVPAMSGTGNPDVGWERVTPTPAAARPAPVRDIAPAASRPAGWGR